MNIYLKEYSKTQIEIILTIYKVFLKRSPASPHPQLGKSKLPRGKKQKILIFR